MIRVDQRSPQDISRLIDFAAKDPFWRSNILSPSSLRRNFDRLMLKAGPARGGTVDAVDFYGTLGGDG
jgi:hypothetical protein